MEMKKKKIKKIQQKHRRCPHQNERYMLILMHTQNLLTIIGNILKAAAVRYRVNAQKTLKSVRWNKKKSVGGHEC